LLQLLEACCHASPVDIDADSCLCLANASFASVSGRGKLYVEGISVLSSHMTPPKVFSARELMATTGAIDVSWYPRLAFAKFKC